MPDPTHRLRLFVSSGPDLEAEQEAIGQAVAQVPVPSLGWRIGRTPRQGEPQFVAWDEIATADFYVLLLGSDIRAPVGAELLAARRAGKRVLAYRMDVRRTQAAEAFARDAALGWVECSTARQLARTIQMALAEEIAAQGPARGLPLVEQEALQGFVERLRRGETEVPSGAKDGGAGGGGVILVPGKDLPPGGVLMGEEEEGDEPTAA
ncbi:MAG: hypothetical protein JSV36_21705 [Anaerolineae bacterium]|nr:MAG: hypothetical protein JSV36_21705 [Anaerolineae bacterium]